MSTLQGMVDRLIDLIDLINYMGPSTVFATDNLREA